MFDTSFLQLRFEKDFDGDNKLARFLARQIHIAKFPLAKRFANIKIVNRPPLCQLFAVAARACTVSGANFEKQRSILSPSHRLAGRCAANSAGRRHGMASRRRGRRQFRALHWLRALCFGRSSDNGHFWLNAAALSLRDALRVSRTKLCNDIHSMRREANKKSRAIAAK